MSRICVIVPVYNAEKYLQRCVDSICAQSLNDIEILLVDDGSTDRSGLICDYYLEMDHRIKVIHQSNQGRGAVRNTGLDWAFTNSDCQWIAFVDADDWVHPDYLMALLSAVEKNNLQISECRFIRVNEDTESHRNDSAVEPISEYDFRIISSEDALTHGGRNIYSYLWDKLYKKELWEGIRFPLNRDWEDTATLYKVLLRTEKTAFVDAELYYYFINDNGVVHQDWNKKKTDHLWALKQALRDDLLEDKPGIRTLFWRQYLSTIDEFIRDVPRSSLLNPKEKRRYVHKYSFDRRLFLVFHGQDAGYSIKKNSDIYSRGFPELNWLYWVGVGITNKIKRILQLVI